MLFCFYFTASTNFWLVQFSIFVGFVRQKNIKHTFISHNFNSGFMTAIFFTLFYLSMKILFSYFMKKNENNIVSKWTLVFFLSDWKCFFYVVYENSMKNIILNFAFIHLFLFFNIISLKYFTFYFFSFFPLHNWKFNLPFKVILLFCLFSLSNNITAGVAKVIID